MIVIPINPNFWSYKFKATSSSNGSIRIVKEDYKFGSDIAEWLEERGYPYTACDKSMTITFEDPQHAFDFKVRWL